MFARQQIVQRRVRKRRSDRDDALMRFEWDAFEEIAPFEPNGDVALFGLREERAKPRIFGTVRRHVNQAQFFAGIERFADGVNTVDQIVEVDPSPFDSTRRARSAQDDTSVTTIPSTWCLLWNL
jgi:hypothetical protein